MVTKEYARTMARYNRWMNERLYAFCADIPDAERKRDAGAFFKSIHGTLNHLLLGDRVWMGRFTGPEFRPPSLAQELYADFGELRRGRASTDDAITAWAGSLTQGAIGIVRFFNHQTHHRGQLTTLLSQRGIDPGVTDLMWLPQAQAAGEL